MSVSIKGGALAVAFLCLSVAGGLLAVDQARALSSKAPDTNAGGGYDNSNSRFVLERTGQNTVTSIQVPVYVPNKPTSAVSMSAVDFYYPWSFNKPRVSFQGGAYTSSAKNFTIPRASFVEDKTTGYWKAFATAQMDGSAMSTYAVAEFRLRVNVSGGLIGIGGGKRYSTIPQNYYTTNNNDTYNYNIPFATPCNVGTNTIKSIALDDLDSGTIDNRWNRITVRVYDETAGQYISLSQNSGSSMSGDYNARMTFKPGHKYRLRINNVHANNTLVYTFPYDNIAYKVGCAWSLLGINSQNRVKVGGVGNFSSYGNYHQGSTPRTVRPGDVVQFQHAVKNSGNMETSTFSRWRERSGWQGTSGWPQAGGTFQSRLDAGEVARWPASPTNYTIKTSDVGRTLCERYGVRGQSSTSGSTYRSVGSCVRATVNWSVSGTTTINRTTAAPGDTITWTHRLVNNGPDKTHTSIASFVGRSGFTSNSNLSSVTISAGKPKGDLRSNFTTTYKITNADLGKTLCHQLRWTPRSSTNSAQGLATNRCVTVPYNFNLIPSLTGPNGSITPGSNIPDIIPSVNNEIPSQPSRTTPTPPGIQWQLTRFTVAPGNTKPVASSNTTAPCAYFQNGCVVRDSGTRSFPAGSTLLQRLQNETVDANLPVGSFVCFGLSVQPRASSSTQWRHAVLCLTVNKRPTVQIWGGDARSGGRIETALTNGERQDGTPASFGSWTEYGAFSKGPNSGLASGSGLAIGSTGVIDDVHKYTFANIGPAPGNAKAYGSFNFGTYTSLAGQFQGLAATSTLSVAPATVNVGSLNGVYRPAGNVIIDGGTIGAGKTVIINAGTRTVTIKGNIDYHNGPLTSVAQIPQLVIIASNIYIEQAVTNVDAWLLASNAIDTCSNVGSRGQMPTSGVLTDAICNQQLIVNGPTEVNRLILKRTGGSEPGAGRTEAAEVFKVRPDAYMWLQSRAVNNGQVRAITVTELPPRF